MPISKRPRQKIKLGICGCGAIGSRIAHSLSQELKQGYRLAAIHDRDPLKAERLASELKRPVLKKDSFADFLSHCDFMVEAVTPDSAQAVIQQALKRDKDVLVMNIGRLLLSPALPRLARRKHCQLLIPSGAVSGLDTIKAASLKNISRITLTTRKPLKGFANNPYLKKRGVRLNNIKRTTAIFEGPVSQAIKYFPRNINVAATLALASGQAHKLLIRILTAPHFTHNSHEVEIVGDFGRMVSRTVNNICPDNPKTSYLAVLSAIQTLKDFAQGGRIGT